MIKSLHIKNYAIIEALDIEFSRGLTIITGETGAGKSILLGALGLIMGERADSKVLYIEDTKCVVEAVFDVEAYNLKTYFEEQDLDYDHETIIRREISPSGKSRAFVNDIPVRLSILQDLSSSLVDLHHQFDTIQLNKQNTQLQMIDALAGNKEKVIEYNTLYKAWNKNQRELAALNTQRAEALKNADFIRFQLNELHEAELEEDEQAAIENSLNALQNAESTKLNLQSAYSLLISNEGSLSDQLLEISRLLQDSAQQNAEVAHIFSRLKSMNEELSDLGRDIERLAEHTVYDEELIHEKQNRLDEIYRLLQKHQVADLSDLLKIQEELSGQATSFDQLDKHIEKLEKEIKSQENKLSKKAESLSKSRKKAIPTFEKKVKVMLSDLSMKNARFVVDLSPLDRFGPSGLEQVQFLFAANKGGKIQPVKEVASGGELARLSLVTKSLVAASIPLPTIIFDEIDVGVSGDVALKMGNILRQLSNEHQVVSITHSPQIASKADAHYFVYKKDTDTRTIAKVRLLNTDERIRAIATMLSQNPPSKSALENAKELLSIAGNHI